MSLYELESEVPYKNIDSSRLRRRRYIKSVYHTERQLYYLVTGGYSDLRSMRGQNPEGDYLQATGAMMRSLNVTKLTETSVSVGFDDPVQEQKALWLSVTGAGRSRRPWRFMGLQAAQEVELAEYVGQLIVGSGLKVI